jgi:hypothetical protein
MPTPIEEIPDHLWMQLSLAMNGEAAHDAKTIRDFAYIFDLCPHAVADRLALEWAEDAPEIEQRVLH